MRSSWITYGITWVARKSVINVQIRAGGGETQTCRGDAGLETVPETGGLLPRPRNANHCQELGVTRKDPPLRPLWGVQSCDPLVADFLLPAG